MINAQPAESRSGTCTVPAVAEARAQSNLGVKRKKDVSKSASMLVEAIDRMSKSSTSNVEKIEKERAERESVRINLIREVETNKQDRADQRTQIPADVLEETNTKASTLTILDVLEQNLLSGRIPSSGVDIRFLLYRDYLYLSIIEANGGVEDLDSTLWQQLPFELLETILTKLPGSTLMNWCQVCKRWKTLIQSHEFARRCDSIEPLVFFHYFGKADSVAYLAIPNTKTNRWEKHTLDFASEGLSVLAADQGLICFETGSQSTKDILFVYNPLTRQWKELRIPPEECNFTYDRSKLVGLIVDQETGSYKLVATFLKDVNEWDETKTLIYESVSSTWTSSSSCPDFPLGDQQPGYWCQWKPGASVRCGEKLYWLVEQIMEFCGTAFRVVVSFDVRGRIWTVDEPDLPYELFVGDRQDDPPDFPYTRFVIPDPYGTGSKPPQWNFHLATNDGAVYAILFESLISRGAFSGEFSSLIPEVRIIDTDFVRTVRELAKPPEHYLPTKAVSHGEVWYVVFEYGGVSRGERGKRPLLVFAYDPRRNVWGWLPELDSSSSCRDVMPEDYPPFWLPQFFTCTLSLRAFV
ncbi:hypothetical protein R1sor_009588 [Riccia sorocarpa]|uniref:F-box domain-containing protein n=1 Tax=Riccia sorocarpa TaxID=122646 RepID=A0ABD3HYA5_9MARC